MNEANPQEQGTPQTNLGLAGQTAKAFITSPLSSLLLIAFLAIGMLGMMSTPRQEDPQVSVPMVDLFVQYQGASAEEVESLIARPLEAIMSEMTGVDHVYSASYHGEAVVTVQFEVGEELESSLVKLHDKLSSNKDKMPMGASPPLVKPKGIDDVPVVAITLWSNEVDDSQLRLLGLDVIQQLREVKNTSQSFIVDGRRDEVRVEILPERLATFGVSLGQVAQAIQLANAERNIGSVEPGSRVYKVYSGSFLESAADVKSLMVAVIDGRPVYVRDVANVVDGPSEATRTVGYYTGQGVVEKGWLDDFSTWFAGEETQVAALEEADNAAAVTLAIAKKKGSNGVDVAEAILKKLGELEGRSIPDNVNVAITRNYGQSAKDKVNSLIMKLFIATGIVSVLVFIALGWRAALVVTLVIPAVITMTVFAAWIFGMTIDRVSLFALIFSIGILVDDAIVVVENIYRRWLLANQLDTDTAVDAVREVGNPTILATFTVIAALVPMAMVSGMMGPYMSPIPILGSVAMLISLFAAFAFTPWLTNKFKPDLDRLHADAEKEHKQAAWLERFFRGLILPLITDLRKGWMLLIGIILVFFLFMGLFYTKSVRVKMLPLDNKPEFNVVVNMPEGTAFPETANLTHTLASKLRAELPEVTALQAYSGTSSPFNFNGLVRHYYLRSEPWHADIQVQLVDKGDRARSSHEIAVEARALLTPLAKAAGARIQVVEMPPGPPVLQSVVAEIYGPSAETRRQVAEDLTAVFEEAEGLGDVDNMMEASHEILRFEVDADKAQRKGISVDDINRTLEMAMGRYIIGDVKQNALTDPTPIVMQIPLSVRSQIKRLIQLPVTNRMGQSVALSELGKFKRYTQDKPIFHKDLRAVEFVTAETVGSYAAPVYGQFEVQDLLAEANDGKGYVTPDGVNLGDEGGYWFKYAPDNDEATRFVWGGEWTVTFETFRDMGIAFMGALVLIYMLIVAQFGNFTLPAIIMAPIPLTLIGIMPGHWLLDAEFTATSMIGFIALAGIIVRNSILLVDFAREEVRAGKSVVEAVICSCEARTRPIVITALALMGGSMVILSDPIFQGMAVSLIFGGFVSTLLTLLVIPLGCISASNALRGDAPALEGGNDPDPNGGGSSARRLASDDTPDSKKTMSLGKAGKNAVVYTGMYGAALGTSFVNGVRGWFDAGVRWRKNRRNKKEAVWQASEAEKKARVQAAKDKADLKAREQERERADAQARADADEKAAAAKKLADDQAVKEAAQKAKAQEDAAKQAEADKKEKAADVAPKKKPAPRRKPAAKKPTTRKTVAKPAAKREKTVKSAMPAKAKLEKQDAETIVEEVSEDASKPKPVTRRRTTAKSNEKSGDGDSVATTRAKAPAKRRGIKLKKDL